MARENVMSTPIFDQLLREMAQRAEPRATAPKQEAKAEDVVAEPARATATRRRHRAD
jgi:hypothetical protein